MNKNKLKVTRVWTSTPDLVNFKKWMEDFVAEQWQDATLNLHRVGLCLSANCSTNWSEDDQKTWDFLEGVI